MDQKNHKLMKNLYPMVVGINALLQQVSPSIEEAAKLDRTKILGIIQSIYFDANDILDKLNEIKTLLDQTDKEENYKELLN
jgi:hypothetical protein